MRNLRYLLSALVLTTLFTIQSFAAQADRIRSIDSANLVELRGHVAPMAQAQFDQGPVESSHAFSVTMLLQPTLLQQQQLNKLIADQQDPSSPNFQKWLSPEQFADRFGVSQNDIQKISAWLQSRGLKVSYVARGRDFLSFEGNTTQVESLLQTQIHYYNVNGKMHFANTAAPRIPAALQGIVTGFRGLHDFTPRPMLRKHPDFTITTNSGSFTFLAPGDIATIYDINPLLNSGIDGTGQTVAIAGQSDVYLADLNFFRIAFGIPQISGCTTNSNGLITACNATNFQMVIPTNGADPGVSAGDLGESDLDIEWLSSVARKAKIVFVTSSAASGGVDTSAAWAIDNKLAPVISFSYGLCEAFATAPGIVANETEYAKAASFGISFFAASGDAGSAVCDGDNRSYPAILGPSVSYPASSPNVTGVGGTEFNEGTGIYWGTTNGTDGGSVLPNGPLNGYIPELAWNDTAFLASIGQSGFDATGGGPSNCAFASGTTSVGGFTFSICKAPTAGGFAKPSWQTALTPADGVRDVPDISFSASNANDPYVVCVPQSETTGTASTSTCSSGSGQTAISNAVVNWNSAFGGTSASTPVAAGMTVLLNQYLGTSGLGNINPQLYKVYGSHASAFHDVTTGSNSNTLNNSDNKQPCTVGTPTFTGWPAALQCPASGIIGYSAGSGYDLTTGLGSIDFNAFFQAWAATRTASSATISASPSGTVNSGTNVTFTATVTTSTSATGKVTFTDNGSTTLGTATVSGTTATFSTTSLPGGSNSVTATYNGDGYNAPSSPSSPVTILVPSFTLSLGSASATVIAGDNSAPIQVTVNPVNGYNQTTTLSCTTQSGSASGATCSFSPATVTPPTTTQSSMTISTLPSMVASNGTPITVLLSVNGTNGGTITSPPQTLTLTVNPTNQSFTLAPQNPTYTTSAGGTVNATVVITPTNGFNTPVTYTCTANTAPQSICTAPSGAQPATTNPQFNITTTAPTGALHNPFERGSRIFYAAFLPGLLGIVFTFGSRKRAARGMRLMGMILMLGASTLWLGACSGSNSQKNAGTPPGSYTATVNATTGGANPVTATTTINFTVQ